MARFGLYEVLNVAAAGSTGTVYRARHTELNRIAAVKELTPALRSLPGLLDRLRTEARVLSELDSPHVVVIYDYVEEPHRAWIAEEWVEGASLEAILATHGRLSAEQSLGVIKGALTGLACAHDRDLVHGDIAPANILADMEGTSKLVDFGLAAPVGRTGACGTPAYVSPEAARGDTVGKTSDVYSAAAVLYSLLTGHPPFRARDAAGMLRSHLTEPAPPLVGQGLGLADLVSRSMAKDPALRPADAAAFLAEFEVAAQERYGTGWWQRASIVGAVASAARASSATAVGSGATVADGATVVTSAAVATGAAVVATARRGVSKVAALTTASVVVVAAAGTAVAVAVSHSASQKRSPLLAIPPAVASATAAAAVAAEAVKQKRVSAPVGEYTLTQVVTASNLRGFPVGKSFTSKWILALTCNPAGCTGSIQDGSDMSFARFDGKALVQEVDPKPSLDEGPCADPITRKLVLGTHFKRTTLFTVTPLVVTKRAATTDGQPGVPISFTGTLTQTETIIETSANCNMIPKEAATFRRTLTRTG